MLLTIRRLFALLGAADDDGVVEGTWSYSAPASGHPPGMSPSGAMKVAIIPNTICPGFRCNTIQIDYAMEAGTQKEYHPSPGTAFPSTVRTAYLPNDPNGREVLKRLKYAFLDGQTFTIGTSTTSRASNVITWSFVHHKTSLTGGIHGYPDPNYILTCTRALDHVGVPQADMIRLPRPLEGLWEYSAPSSLTHLESCIRRAPNIKAQAECPICLSTMPSSSSTVVMLESCKHRFHDKCLKAAMEHKPNCPVCRKPIRDEPQGKSPSGTMKVSILSNIGCRGFDSCNNTTIRIGYSMKEGLQREYHPAPGVPYGSTTRTAYLPNNDDGRKLLQRLKYAFMHGLTFTVGTSLTSGATNVITWSSIHHKTSQSGGVYGYPDPHFFSKCNGELDALGVPDGATAESIEALSLV